MIAPIAKMKTLVYGNGSVWLGRKATAPSATVSNRAHTEAVSKETRREASAAVDGGIENNDVTK
jgi:hypothetical protein